MAYISAGIYGGRPEVEVGKTGFIHIHVGPEHCIGLNLNEAETVASALLVAVEKAREALEVAA